MVKSPPKTSVAPFSPGGGITGDFYFLFCTFLLAFFTLSAVSTYHFCNQRKTINVIPERKKTSTEGSKACHSRGEAARGGGGKRAHALTRTRTHAAPAHERTCSHACTHLHTLTLTPAHRHTRKIPFLRLRAGAAGMKFQEFPRKEMDGRKEKRRKRRQTRKTRDRWTDTRSQPPAQGVTLCDAGRGLLKLSLFLW